MFRHFCLLAEQLDRHKPLHWISNTVKLFKHSSVQIENQTDRQTKRHSHTFHPPHHILQYYWEHTSSYCAGFGTTMLHHQASLISHQYYTLNEINTHFCNGTFQQKISFLKQTIFQLLQSLISCMQVWCKVIVKALLKGLLSWLVTKTDHSYNCSLWQNEDKSGIKVCSAWIT